MKTKSDQQITAFIVYTMIGVCPLFQSQALSAGFSQSSYWYPQRPIDWAINTVWSQPKLAVTIIICSMGPSHMVDWSPVMGPTKTITTDNNIETAPRNDMPNNLPDWCLNIYKLFLFSVLYISKLFPCQVDEIIQHMTIEMYRSSTEHFA